MKKSRSQIACPDSGSGFILGESDKSSIFLKTGFRFLRAGPLGTFQKLRFEDLGVFVRIVIFLFLLTIVFLLSFSRPPGVCQNKKSPSHFQSSQSFVGAGSGIRLSATNPSVSQDVLWGLFFSGMW